MCGPLTLVPPPVGAGTNSTKVKMKKRKSQTIDASGSVRYYSQRDGEPVRRLTLSIEFEHFMDQRSAHRIFRKMCAAIPWFDREATREFADNTFSAPPSDVLDEHTLRKGGAS